MQENWEIFQFETVQINSLLDLRTSISSSGIILKTFSQGK